MSTTINASSTSILNYGRSDQSVAVSSPSLALILANEASAENQLPSSTDVALSDQAKAYLAQTASSTDDRTTSASTRATAARQWFDQQYQALGISSALLDGKVAVDLTGQSRATLSAVAANTDNRFSQDERSAAAQTLQFRFNAALSPHVVIARHTGNYAPLYEAALKYADQAGPDEQATSAWKDQKQALVDGLAAAKKTIGKAPDTANSNDPVKALLSSTTAGGSSASGTTIADVAANARKLLDGQIASAKDQGKELVFDASDKNGQQASFATFDNRALAAVALNQGAAFSREEVRAAKTELDQRHRSDILSVMKSAGESGDASSGYLGLLQQYSGMSAEEKAALGISGTFANRLVQNYRSASATQGAFGGGAATRLTSYL